MSEATPRVIARPVARCNPSECLAVCVSFRRLAASRALVDGSRRRPPQLRIAPRALGSPPRPPHSPPQHLRMAGNIHVDARVVVTRSRAAAMGCRPRLSRSSLLDRRGHGRRHDARGRSAQWRCRGWPSRRRCSRRRHSPRRRRAARVRRRRLPVMSRRPPRGGVPGRRRNLQLPAQSGLRVPHQRRELSLHQLRRVRRRVRRPGSARAHAVRDRGVRAVHRASRRAGLRVCLRT